MSTIFRKHKIKNKYFFTINMSQYLAQSAIFWGERHTDITNWVGDLDKTLEILKETSIISKGSCDFCFDPSIWVKMSHFHVW